MAAIASTQPIPAVTDGLLSAGRRSLTVGLVLTITLVASEALAVSTVMPLVARDLGARNGTWVFLEEPHLLTEGDLLLVGSQIIRFRRLGYPGPYAPEVDATKRMGSLTPSADIASLTQLRADGSARDVIQLSPGRDLLIGREKGDWTFPYDPSMSAQHALVRSEDADFVVVDAGSRNGIAVAARGAMPLTNGSRILVGDKLLRIEIP